MQFFLCIIIPPSYFVIMKIKLILLFFCMNLWGNVQAQETQSFKDDRGNEHLCGPFSLNDLEENGNYQKWYKDSYDAFELSEGKKRWAKKLKGMEVDVYLGTWCGDSQNWVPKFVKLWEELGLKREQLNFIALYNNDVEGKYKKGPNGETEGKMIHRVPTFIFSQDEREIARIVESPKNDLETDVAQIAFGYPSQPNYGAANYMMNLLQTNSLEEIKKNKRKYVRNAYYKASKVGDLNTLGYVYMQAGEIEKAKLVFEFNTYLFRYNPNVFDSYAEALAKNGEDKAALKYYEKAFEMKPKNKNAEAQIKRLKERMASIKE